jgi:N,N'-diacetyllegionaminate synthase
VRTQIIAEAGVNHNGDLSMAKQLVHVAADAGADLVKFQTFRTSRNLTADAPKAAYQEASVSLSQYDMVLGLELSRQDHLELVDECRQCGIEFFSTAFDAESLDLLIDLGFERFKIPSGEITNLPFLRRLGSYGGELIISTGMATIGEIDSALEALVSAGTPRERVTVLHCNTQYPTPMEDVNLRAMLAIRDGLKVAVGYSDHTLGMEVPIAAVALGATVIEKHFTLDRSLPGPDHQASLEPQELADMVAAIRNIERALGDGIKRPSPSESPNKVVIRKSVVAATAIRSGETFTEENLAVKRPGTGISPMLWDLVVGRSASRDYAPDELIEL